MKIAALKSKLLYQFWSDKSHATLISTQWCLEGRGFDNLGWCELEMSQRLQKPTAIPNPEAAAVLFCGSVPKVGTFSCKFGGQMVTSIIVILSTAIALQVWRICRAFASSIILLLFWEYGPNLYNVPRALVTSVSAWELANCLLDYTRTRRRSSRSLKPSETINGDPIWSVLMQNIPYHRRSSKSVVVDCLSNHFWMVQIADSSFQTRWYRL